MQLISTVTVGAGGASSITFSSIPQTATDLVVCVSGRGDAAIVAGDLVIQINGANVPSYASRMLYGTGSTVTSSSTTSAYAVNTYNATQQASGTANTFGSFQIYLPNYTGSSNKTLSIDAVVENNATAAGLNLTAGIYNSTSAITSITIMSSGNWVQYSTATLYGITKGSGGATVA